jgi:hypothetical protein
LINPKGFSSKESVVFGVKERNLYMLKGQPLQVVASRTIAENKEQVAPKVEQLKGSQPSGLDGKQQPSNFFKELWYEMAM